ncbi:MAG: hypothetical protein J6O55_02340 [Lachnospiraceae bacterium]|nr:hypothetical protein [Lachnospiraceae bacterium]
MSKKEFGIIKFNSVMLATVLELLVNAVLQTADNAITGYVVGMDGLSALNLFLPWILTMNFFGILFGGGAAILYARYQGEFERDRAGGIFTLGTIACLVSGLIVVLASLVLMGPYLKFMGSSDELSALIYSYRNFYLPCLFFQPITLFFISIVYADGGEVVGMAASITESVGNIALSIPLGLNMGIGGIALGTSLSMMLSLLVLCTHFFRKNSSVHLSRSFAFKDLFEISLYGFPESSMFFFMMLLSAPIDKFVAARFGEEYLPALTVLFSLIEFSLVFEAAGEALRPILPVYLGEGNSPALKRLLHHAMKSAIILGALTTAFYLLGAPLITRIYNISEPFLEGGVITGIRLFSLSCIPMAIVGLLDSYYLYSEKVDLSLFSYFIKYFAADIALSIPLSLIMGMNGLWLGFGLAPLLSLVLLLIFVRLRRRGEKIPYLISDNDNVWDCTVEVNASGIGRAMDMAESFLESKGVSKERISNTIFNLEETLGLIAEINPGKTVIAECSIKLDGDSTELIIWDNGKIVDITNPDSEISGFRSYAYPLIMNKNIMRANLVTVGFNRNRIVF